MPYIIVEKNSKAYRIFDFSTNTKIGRGKSNDIVLCNQDDSAVSRNHVSIKCKKGEYILYDKSSNGTFVEGDLIKEYTLQHGTRFQIASYFFTFINLPSDKSDVQSSSKEQSPFPKDYDLDSENTVFISRPEETLKHKLHLKKKLRKAGIIAENDAVLSLFMDIEEIVKINVPVLILGEPGTGKEKVAQTLHTFSMRKGAFVPLNCSSIPEGIFESELFGSKKGAFHNATDKPGKIELAENGTLFLDEIGDMILPLQPKLLRFLEDKEVTRLGGTQPKKVDVRLVAATNQDLKSLMEKKMFRSDLYQRLACITLKVPPLRERKEDIRPLAHFFLAQYSTEHNLKDITLTEDAQKMLVAYDWPGNVRELNNVLLGASIRSRNGVINQDQLAEIAEEVKTENNTSQLGFPSMSEMEINHIKSALIQADGNKQLAAKLLGISRDTLYNKIRKYKIV